MRENEAPVMISNDHVTDTENSTISFRVPHVIKGPKSKQAKNVVEKKIRKKKKSCEEKGTNLVLHVLNCLLPTHIFNCCKYISDIVGEEVRNRRQYW
jgi:hypothetical protein